MLCKHTHQLFVFLVCLLKLAPAITSAVVTKGNVSSSGSFCDQIHHLLGSDCTASNATECLDISCNINLLGIEQIQVEIDLHGAMAVLIVCLSCLRLP
jgi:hypothetical protein